MKRYLLILFSFFASSFFTFSKAQLLKGNFTYWAGISSIYFYGNSIVQTKNNGYAIAGYDYNIPVTMSDPITRNMCILSLDSIGNFQWDEEIGGSGNDVAFSIIQTQDGGYAVTGLTTYPSAGGSDVFVAKLDSGGNMQWGKTIGGMGDDVGKSIIQTMDGGYAIAGYTDSYGLDSSTNVYIIKLNSAGAVSWTKTYGGPETDEGYSIIQSKDGGYAITGSTTSYGAGGEDVYVLKLDSAGNLQWTRTVGGTGDDAGQSIIQTTEGNYVMTGYTDSYGAGSWDVYVIKLDSAGDLIWTKTIGGGSYDQGFSIIQTKDGDYTLTGLTGSFSPSEQVYVVRLDSAGNLQWTKTIGGTMSNQNGKSIVQTKDIGYAIVGSTSYNTSIYMLKLDSVGNTCDSAGNGGTITTSDSGRIDNGGSITSIDSGKIGGSPAGGHQVGVLNIICSVTGIENINSTISEINIFPNPTPGIFTIALAGFQNFVPATIEIYNVMGERVESEKLKVESEEIDLTGQPNGIYLYRVLKEDGSVLGCGKVVIAK